MTRQTVSPMPRIKLLATHGTGAMCLADAARSHSELGADHTRREFDAMLPRSAFLCLRRFHIPVAVSTDLNPGTSSLMSLRLVKNLAWTLFPLPRRSPARRAR